LTGEEDLRNLLLGLACSVAAASIPLLVSIFGPPLADLIVKELKRMRWI